MFSYHSRTALIERKAYHRQPLVKVRLDETENIIETEMEHKKR